MQDKYQVLQLTYVLKRHIETAESFLSLCSLNSTKLAVDIKEILRRLKAANYSVYGTIKASGYAKKTFLYSKAEHINGYSEDFYYYREMANDMLTKETGNTPKECREDLAHCRKMCNQLAADVANLADLLFDVVQYSESNAQANTTFTRPGETYEKPVPKEEQIQPEQVQELIQLMSQSFGMDNRAPTRKPLPIG